MAKTIGSKMTSVLACTGLVAGVVGCGTAADYDEQLAYDDGVPSDEQAVDSEHAVKHGNVAGGQGAVMLTIGAGYLCTGAVISPNVVLTASHCFKHTSSALEFNTDVGISYTEDGTNWQCLTGGGAGACGYPSPVSVKRLGDGSKPENDFAVIVYQPGFVGFDDYRGIQTNPGESDPYVFYGAGANSDSGSGSGTMRSFTDNIDWAGSQHFFTESGNSRVCGGDSGGPYLSMSRKYLIGIHASSEKWPDSECARESYFFLDAHQRANRMIDSHIPFINEFLDRTMGGTPHSRCEHQRDNLYWCAPPRPVVPVPCMQRCTSNCGNLITSGGQDFGYDVCVQGCPAQCGE